MNGGGICGDNNSTEIRCAEVLFTETTGAGTYTGTISLPAGSTLIDIQVQSTALWDTATSATMIVGDADDEGAARLNVVSDPTPAIVQRALNDVSVAHPAIVT